MTPRRLQRLQKSNGAVHGRETPGALAPPQTTARPAESVREDGGDGVPLAEREHGGVTTLEREHATEHERDPQQDAQHDDGHDHEEVDLNVKEPRRLWVIVAAVLGALALAALLVVGLVPRHQQTKELEADAAAAENAPVPVNVARPRRSPVTVEVSIPGTLRPWQEVSLYARTSGYLKKYYVDISNDVKATQLMAEIESPEVDQELIQARAAAAKAAADRDLAKATWERFAKLRKPEYISEQEAQEKESAYHVAEANLNAANANVERLVQTQGFQKVTAPFDGVVTGRGFDVGSLITANPTSADVKPLFKIADNSTLRAFVNVPQSSSLGIYKEMEVKVFVREVPNRFFTGKVMGTTNYLDPLSRSLLTEIKIPNERRPDGRYAIMPGMFVTANFQITRDVPPLIVPAAAVVNNADGTFVVVVTDFDKEKSEGKAHYQKVTLGQDFGSEIEIVSGLKESDLVIANPGERVVEGGPIKSGKIKDPEPAAPTTAPATRPTTGPTTQPVRG